VSSGNIRKGSDAIRKISRLGILSRWALLILVQLALVFSPQQQVGTAETPAVTHRTTAIPGIMGGLSLVFGIGLYVTNRNKRQE